MTQKQVLIIFGEKIFCRKLYISSHIGVCGNNARAAFQVWISQVENPDAYWFVRERFANKNAEDRLYSAKCMEFWEASFDVAF